MLYYKDGDLLESDCTTILHQANSFSVMGAGIAKAIADKYPEAHEADASLERSPEEKYGDFTCAIIGSGRSKVTVGNLYGQYGTGKVDEKEMKERMFMLDKALNQFLLSAKNELKDLIDLKKVGVPHGMGCGLAGGDWSIVKDILERASLKHEVDIYIYKL